MWNNWARFIMCDSKYRNIRRLIIKSMIKKLIKYT